MQIGNQNVAGPKRSESAQRFGDFFRSVIKNESEEKPISDPTENADIVSEEEHSPEFADLKAKIAEYENLVIHNATLSENVEGDFIPQRNNVLGRQREIIRQIREDINTDVMAILRSAINETEVDQLVDFLRSQVNDPNFRDQLLNHRVIVVAERYLQGKKDNPEMDSELHEPQKGSKNASPKLETSKVDIPATDIRMDTPGDGSFLVSKGSMQEEGDEEFTEGLEKDSPFLGESGDPSRPSLGSVDIRKISESRRKAEKQITKEDEIKLARDGIKVMKAPRLDDSPVQIGFGGTEEATDALSPQQRKIDAIKTGFSEEQKTPIEKLDLGIGEKEPKKSGAPKIEEEEPEEFVEIPKPESQKEKALATIKRMDKQTETEKSGQIDATEDAPKKPAEKPKHGKGFFAGVWNQIAKNKQVGADVLARLQEDIITARAEKPESQKAELKIKINHKFWIKTKK